MTTSVDAAFIKQYESEVKEAYQRQGSKLQGATRLKSEVQGTSTTFQRTGRGSAAQKPRNGLVPVMNTNHTPIECTIADWYGGDWIDKLDELKINIDERMVLANAGAWALGRKTDDLIFTAALTTATTPVAITTTNSKTARNSINDAVGVLDAADVPDDGRRFGIVDPQTWKWLMSIAEFTSADYVNYDALPYKLSRATGQPPKMWNRTMWIMHSGLPVSGNIVTNFIWHYASIGVASGADIRTEITYHGERVAHFVNSFMAMGAALIDGEGVVPLTLDKTAALPTS